MPHSIVELAILPVEEKIISPVFGARKPRNRAGSALQQYY